MSMFDKEFIDENHKGYINEDHPTECECLIDGKKCEHNGDWPYCLETKHGCPFTKPVKGITYTWTDKSGDGNWDNPDNWEPKGVPKKHRIKKITVEYFDD